MQEEQASTSLDEFSKAEVCTFRDVEDVNLHY